MIENSTAVTNPSIVTFGTMYAAKSTNAAFTTSEKSPSVSTFIGSVRMKTMADVALRDARGHLNSKVPHRPGCSSASLGTSAVMPVALLLQ